jgi:divinyl protochlorophyllide a 8-vinyl-reductase
MQDRAPHSGTPGPARIGPNAILRVAEALRERTGEQACASLFERAGLAHHLVHPPSGMVEERDVTVLQATLRAGLGLAAARTVLRDAGARTGDYLLAHRIPRAVQALLHVLPAPLASRVLLAAIARNAWTFCGSGRFSVRRAEHLHLIVAGCPLCRGEAADQPLCDYYAGTFERLFRVLVHPATRVEEAACRAQGAEACVFQAAWAGEERTV